MDELTQAITRFSGLVGELTRSIDSMRKDQAEVSILLSKNTTALIDQGHQMKSAIDVVMQAKNGITPLGMMQISDHKDIVRSYMVTQKGQVNSLLKTFGLVLLFLFPTVIGVTNYTANKPERSQIEQLIKEVQKSDEIDIEKKALTK